MNHADRQRLSTILKYIDDNESDLLTSGVALMLNEARAIVDAPTGVPNVIVKFNGKIGDQDAMRDAVKAAFAEQAPNKTLDAFLSEPIHEYRDRVPTRRRHRALSPLRLALVLTLAAVALVCLTASSQTWGGTDRHSEPGNPSEGPSRAAQSHPSRSANLYTYPPREP